MAPGTRARLGPVLRTTLPATLAAPRQARATVRHALAAWGLDSLSADAQLLASELVANAAEHAGGGPIGLAICQHTEPNGQRGILCQVTDDGLRQPRPQPVHEDSERGRGLQIVGALATRSGVTTNPRGKTVWFTLTARPEPTASTRKIEFEPEPGE